MKINNVFNKTVEEVKNEMNLADCLAARINGRLRELTYIIKTNEVDIEFLDYTNSEATKIYEATLRYVIAFAIFRLYPKEKVRFSYSISRSIFCTFINNNIILDNKILNKIKKEVENIISSDYKIIRVRYEIDEALKMYKSFNMQDKVDILKYREENYVNAYKCEGYTNYMFGYMLPSTGYLKKFNFILYSPGFIIQYPRCELKGKIPKFVDEKVYASTLRDASHWGKIIGVDSISKLNEYSKSRDSQIQFINICETKHNHQFTRLGDEIEKDRENIRLVCIAGPSSSGKTTFANRVKIELLSRGIKPLMISIDNYYLGVDKAPKNTDGTPDLEHIDAIDTKLFNQDLSDLILGKEVELPIFNFKNGSRTYASPIKIDNNVVIIIEGIHGLNEKLTYSIPIFQKYKIFIAPQTQLHIDNHNPLSITDLRLIRRICRDYRTRGTKPEATIAMWSSVRAGEFKWIYPFQNEANFVFNSELTYELAILKNIAVPGLLTIGRESKYFIIANKLLKFLKYFNDFDLTNVPINSLIREFAGGSSFHD